MKKFGISNFVVGFLGLSAACALLAQPPAAPGRGWFGRFSAGPGPGLGVLTNRTITGAPFSALATIQTQRTLANGTQLQQQEQSNVNRDSQGRVRIDTTFTVPTSSGSSTTRTAITIYDPVAGYLYRLNPQTMKGTQSSIPTSNNSSQSGSSSGSGTRTGPNGTQVQTQSLGTETINGVMATGTQVTTTIPAGAIGNTQAIQVVRVTWVSTALQIPVQVTVTDPRMGNSAMNLTNIVQTEPSETLFQVPSGYTLTTAPSRGGHASSSAPRRQQ
jgi:hypothetical protein